MSTPHLAVTPVTTGSSKIGRTATSPQELAEQRSQRPTAERRTFAPRRAPTDEPQAQRWYPTKPGGTFAGPPASQLSSTSSPPTSQTHRAQCPCQTGSANDSARG